MDCCICAIAGFGLSKFTEATSNPELLVKGTYTSFKGQEGLRYDEIVSKMGVQPVDMSGMDEEELGNFDLTTNRIKMPGEITGRLAPVFLKRIVDAKIAIEIFPGIEN